MVLMTNERPMTPVVKGDEVKLYITSLSAGSRDKSEKSCAKHSHRVREISSKHSATTSQKFEGVGRISHTPFQIARVI